MQRNARGRMDNILLGWSIVSGLTLRWKRPKKSEWQVDGQWSNFCCGPCNEGHSMWLRKPKLREIDEIHRIPTLRLAQELWPWFSSLSHKASAASITSYRESLPVKDFEAVRHKSPSSDQINEEPWEGRVSEGQNQATALFHQMMEVFLLSSKRHRNLADESGRRPFARVMDWMIPITRVTV